MTFRLALLGLLNATFQVLEEFGVYTLTDSQETALVSLFNAVFLVGAMAYDGVRKNG